MKRIYLLGPLSHAEDGGENEYRLAESAFLNEKQIECLHVHKDLQAVNWQADNEHLHKTVIHRACEQMLGCEEVVTLKDWELCPLAKRQMKLALDLNIAVVPVVNYFPLGYERRL